MTNLFNYCKGCGSYNLQELLEPENSMHYARITCSDCGTFQKWVPKPKPEEISIIRLLRNLQLQDWESNFLKKLVYKKSFTDAESIVVNQLQSRLASCKSLQA